ncbi:hypothetical protein GCM10012275_29110 [Longimycelium tulufanense]|uniref:Uncharacterized protein n=1 Tax=Longimycelium tulufanense TaxID=907463 RepID=A0A8J3CD25_9PSEU|nr:hypothetical protein [Longimycelium tulufanense]GGM56184.1 hypothetical protein GCM10012275_29110 [Longimycelium tulufanense]
MSAGTVPEVAPAGLGTADGPTVRVLAPTDPAHQLAHQMEQTCANAVDPLEIAAALEADGINDRSARERFRRPDVFALARELFAVVPRNPAEPQREPCPWQVQPLTHMTRGVLFALPGACYVALTPLFFGPVQLTLLVVALVASWSAGQGLAYLGWSRLGQLDRGGAMLVLRKGFLLLSGILVTGLVGMAALTGAELGVVALAAGLVVYLLAATVLLVLGAEWQLMSVLLPLVAVCLTYLVLGRPFSLSGWVGGVSATCLIAIALLALRNTRGGPPAKRGSLRARDSVRALPHVLFGVLAAGMVLLATGGLPAADGPSVPSTAVSLSLSMGIAEWLLTGYRQHTYDLLGRCQGIGEFSRQARVSLLTVWFYYLMSTVSLTAPVLALRWEPGVDEIDLAIRGAVPVVAAAALFIALLLQAMGVSGFVLASCAVALIVDVFILYGAEILAMVDIFIPQPTPIWLDPIEAQLGTFGALTVALLIYGGVVVGRVSRHV